MNKGTVKIFLRKDYRSKDKGKNPIYMRVIINKKKKDYSLGIFINKNYWNEDKERIKLSLPGAASKNQLINGYKEKALQVINKAIMVGDDLDIKKFDRDFSGEDNKGIFKEFVLNEIEKRKHNYVYDYYRSLKADVSKFDKFCKDVKIKDIDLDLILMYEQYMKISLGNKVNTIARSMKRLKLFLGYARMNGYIKRNPFEDYRVKTAPTNREYLNIEELNRLYNIYQDNILKDHHQRILQYFLFSCYTGLRYTDLKRLKLKHLDDEMIIIDMHKTGRNVKIPLVDRAKELLPLDLELPEQRVFKVLTNQSVNRHLKVIMKLCSIDKKNISFHCARHTFATVALTIGISMEVVSDILGHSDTRMTKVYAKIVDKLRKSEMQKFNQEN